MKIIMFVVVAVGTLFNTALANPPQGVSGNVTVVNPESSPVPVNVTNTSEAQYVRILLGERRDCTQQTCTDTLGTSTYQVPEGKALLIDEVTVQELFNGLSGLALLSITGVPEQIQLPTIGELSVIGNRSYVGRRTAIHTSGYVSVEVIFEQAPSGLVAINAIVFGRLIDQPSELIDCNPDSCFN